MAIDPEQKTAWLREFQLNGFIVFRGFLPVDLVEQMHDEIKPLLEAEHKKACSDEFARGRGPGRLSLHIDSYCDLFRGALADPRYRRHPLIEELAQAILGEGRVRRGWTVVEAVWKGSVHMAWHSDQKPEDTADMDAAHETIRLTYNIPLIDFTIKSGATEFLPGSHRLPRRFHATCDANELGNIYPALLELRRGDAVLRDGNALHRGTPNLGDAPRPMLDQTYKRA